MSIKSLIGLYYGNIVDNEDPLKMGRHKVRVFEVHGDPDNEQDKLLPWCRVISLGGGTPDTGSYIRYSIGATVLVGFEHGDFRRPIILGGAEKVKSKPLSEYKNPEAGINSWFQNNSKKQESPQEGEDHWQVVYKSVTGHTLMMKDSIGQESLKLIDRAGQVFEFKAPTKVSQASGNANQRGISDASLGTQLPYSSLENKASISVTDLAGQTIKMISGLNQERIEIRSKNRDGESQSILMEGANSEKYIKIESGNTEAVLNGKENTITIKAGSAIIVIDGNANSIKLNAGRIDLN
jgi:hypothetical protein